MIEWVPWFLVLIAWPGDRVDDQQIVRIEVAVDQDECEALGQKYLQEGIADTPDGAPKPRRFLCSPMPDRASFNAAVARWKARLREAPKPE